MTTIAQEITRLQTAKADIKTSLEEKGVTVDSAATLDTYDDYVEELPHIPVPEPEEKDVNFYDWDGTRVYSYTVEELNELEELPAGPIHADLTFQQWVYTLSEMKDIAERFGEIDNAALYDTSDHSVRIEIDLKEDDMLSPTLYFCTHGNASIKIDWGDGTNTEIASNDATDTRVPHTYSSVGKYTISMLSLSGNRKIMFPSENGSEGSSIFNSGGYSGDYAKINKYYRNCITKIFFGSHWYGMHNGYPKFIARLSNVEYITFNNDFNLVLPTYAFAYCYKLKQIAFRNLENSLPFTGGVFYNDYSLKHIIINNISGIYKESAYTSSAPVFQYCYSLKKLQFTTDSFTINAPGAFNYTGLTAIKLPKISNIVSGLFRDADIRIIDFTRNTSIPTLQSSTEFSNAISTFKILVPGSLYNDWIASGNWVNWASHIVPVGPVPYVPEQEEAEDINGILGEDSADPITPDLTEEEIHEELDTIIGGNEEESE